MTNASEATVITPTQLPVDALLFDCDGVIIDSAGLKTVIFREVIQELAPAYVNSAMDYYYANGGVSRVAKFQYIWEHLIGEPLSAERLAHIAATFAQRVEQRVIDAPYIPGAYEFLQQYASSTPCYLISGTPEPELRRIVAARGLNVYFRGVYGSPAQKGPIGQAILEENKFRPTHCAFIGDATTDRHAADVLGMRFIGLTGPHLDPFLRGDEVLLPDLTRLAETLRQMFA